MSYIESLEPIEPPALTRADAPDPDIFTATAPCDGGCVCQSESAYGTCPKQQIGAE
jgi:hypothetical protein